MRNQTVQANTKSNQISIVNPLKSDVLFSIKLSGDSERSAIVIDITSTVNKNIIISLKNADDKIVNMFSWYVMKGRNRSSIKNYDNCEPGLYTIQIGTIYGEIICRNNVSIL